MGVALQGHNYKQNVNPRMEGVDGKTKFEKEGVKIGKVKASGFKS